ncbi:hypothetical protein V6N13_053725 [Hibiscus sabdariffa]|uniref:Uncharacterized protein n=1 Tax=Hibiscus sabdariffa TaxID=183260 RepID=A0ABR2T6P9_9ROSI
MENENFTIFDSKVAEFNQHLGEEEMQSLPMSHPTWAEVVANNNRGQCLDIEPVQPQDQYQAREVGVGQLPGSRFAMPVISSAQDPSQVADAGICQQSGLSDPNQAPEPLYNNMEMDSPLVVSSQSFSWAESIDKINNVPFAPSEARLSLPSLSEEKYCNIDYSNFHHPQNLHYP